MINDYKYSLDPNVIGDHVSENDKLKDEYLIGNIKKAVFDLVHNKDTEETARDFFNGIRDDREFSYLVENYGVGNPVEVPFIPLMNKRINALIGKQLQNDLDYKVLCENPTALDTKMKEKRAAVLNELIKFYNSQIQKVTQASTYLPEEEPEQGGPQEQQGSKKINSLMQKKLKDLKEKYNESWQTDWEIAAQHFINYIIRRKELKKKFNKAFEDLCITGIQAVRTYIKEIGKDPEIKVCSPENLFFSIDSDIDWIEDCRRIVYREYLTKSEILNRFGHFLEKEDRDLISKEISDYYTPYSKEREHVTFYDEEEQREIELSRGSRDFYEDKIEVFHVEWIATNPVKDNSLKNTSRVERSTKNIKFNKRLRQDRYEGYMINIKGGIFFNYGKSSDVVRSIDDPYTCKLSYNGLVYRAKNNKPFSLIMATKELQDLYDLTHFKINNLIQSARPGGTFTVFEHLPTFLGDSPEERLMKTMAYEKTMSTKLISISQEGNEPGSPYSFNNYGNYPSNVDGQTLQALQAYLEILESKADNILGMSRQALGEMEERDGKGTTMMAIQQSELITKQYFYLSNIFIAKTLSNLTNLSKIAYQEGFKGSYIMGENHKMFSIDHPNYELADFNVHIVFDSMRDNLNMQKSQELVNMAVQNQMVPFKDAFYLLTSSSVAEQRRIIKRFTGDQEDQGSIEQMQQQLEEASKQMEEMQKELEKAQKELQNEKDSKKKAELENDKKELELKKEELEMKKDEKERKLQLEMQKVTLQKLQAVSNPTNKDNKIRFDS